jgi:hypothetical protein
MEPRTLREIKLELDELVERRTALWNELSDGHDTQKAAEIADLNARIEALWTEARAAKNRAQFGSQKDILTRARAEERLERDLARVA